VSDADERSKCSCYYVSRHEGREADAYIADHLQEVRVDSERRTIEYRCPLYGKRWLCDEPEGTMHGGGPFRLRTFEAACRDARHELSVLGALLSHGTEAEEHVRALLDALGPCADL
jgi:hypothetical protein